MSLKGRAALITGGASPIGEAIAHALAGAGARVAVHYRKSRAKAVRLAAELGGVAIPGTLPRDAERMVKRAADLLGRLDLLVNNASHIEARGWTDRLDRLDDAAWRAAFEVDVLGTFRCSRAAAAIMRRGKIITIGSIPALAGDRDGIIYATAKAAVIGMTRSLAVLLAPRIQVNCMALGSVETEWTRWLTKRKKRAYRAAIPLGRFGRPEDVARLALHLAQDEWTTGQTLVLDGGEVRR